MMGVTLCAIVPACAFLVGWWWPPQDRYAALDLTMASLPVSMLSFGVFTSWFRVAAGVAVMYAGLLYAGFITIAACVGGAARVWFETNTEPFARDPLPAARIVAR
ncbi:MAG: hypothetical protein AB7P03_05590 [Kofleriaceae bacterium]